jgi:hypothetical protein
LHTSAPRARHPIPSTISECFTVPADCAESKNPGATIKSSDNWRVLLLNDAVDHASEIAAFFFTAIAMRNRFGLGGGFSHDRIGR